jgi:hypothetical protein
VTKTIARQFVINYHSLLPHFYFGSFSEDTFQEIQNDFMEKHYHHFEDIEENKLVYTDIFTQYVSSKCAGLLGGLFARKH